MRANHHVLQDLVQAGADVDVAVGVGRAVVKNVFLPSVCRGAQAVVEAHRLPPLQHSGLALRQPGTHRKIGLRQEQRLGIVAASFGFCGGGSSVVHRLAFEAGGSFVE